ncbi:hypothetical protein V6N12_035586 [Hibiscus sabdariffa]|uniref:Reverse transcriptase zinc-binding domain-containing protein n=1 Tax=Hibiscus sabdariffa TaxID=183260 RepID=A0ABR2EN57_9ROSI
MAPSGEFPIKVAGHCWYPLHFIRNGSLLSHLFFVDDLILYARADMGQVEAIDSILSEFGKFSGHKVSHHLVSSDGNWNLPVLESLFPDSAINHIISIRCSDPLDGNDHFVWRWTPGHNFELKSAYMKMVGSSWPRKQAVWKAIWRLNVPQHVRLFLWIAYQQRLMANTTCHRSLLVTDPSCSNHAFLLHHEPPTLALLLPWEYTLVDSSTIGFFVYLICSIAANSSTISLVCAIIRLRQQNWEIDFTWIPREANSPTNTMSKLANLCDPSLCIFRYVPPEVALPLEFDKLNL